MESPTAPGSTGRRGTPPERWFVLELEPPPRGERFLVVDGLRRLGALLVEGVGGRMVACFPPPARPDAFLAEARMVIRASSSLREPTLRWRWEDSGGWRARWSGDTSPVRVSSRIVVLPEGTAAQEWEPGNRASPSVAIRLLPGLAFGTAHHPTTRSCLRLLEERVRSGQVVLDVGTGSGILAVAAALLGAGRVMALDVDAVAVGVARKNVEGNGVEDRVRVERIRGSPTDLQGRGAFQGVMANIDPGGLVRLIPALVGVLDPGGWLILSGAPTAEGGEVVERALEAGAVAEAVQEEGGWWTGAFRRPWPPAPQRPPRKRRTDGESVTTS